MAFTWFDKFTKACDMIPDEADRARFIVGLVDYATHGTDPGFEYPLSFAWASMKEDVDASLRARRNGGKGGRPKTNETAEEDECEEAGAAGEGAAEDARAAEENWCGFSAENPLLKPLSETQTETSSKPPFRKTENQTENPPFGKPKTQYKTKQDKDKTKQDKTLAGHKRDGGRFSPPSAADVSAYAEGVCKGFDAQRFVDYYAAQGWRLSNGRPMRDWRAAVRNWARRDAARPQPPPGGQADWSMYD